MPRYLTKSRFKLGLECPSKLYYTGKADLYPDKKMDDEFLKALAEGGFQVGELAKLYYPGGIMIEELEHETALRQTDGLLKREKVVIYEAAFLFENLFIRADIIIKDGKKLKLIEVKAKSINKDEDGFVGKKGGLSSSWKPYLYDVAFQKYVIQKAFPEFTTTSHLLLADKTVKASVEGLNQKFAVRKDEHGRTQAFTIGDTSLAALGDRVLVEVNTDDCVDLIWKSTEELFKGCNSFEQTIETFSKAYNADSRIDVGVHAACGSCEFTASDIEVAAGKLSGYRECWKKCCGFRDADFFRQPSLKLWNFRRKEELLADRKYFLAELTEEDIAPKNKSKAQVGLSTLERQLLQIGKADKNPQEAFIDIDGLSIEMKTWKYPLHFIDFETTAVALPFNKGRRPYEQTAFQFSHHIMDENGNVAHVGQWINSDRGVFPNFQFLRQLKQQLLRDEGTIFRYAAHENTILNAIYEQLKASTEPDRNELCDWIKTITKAKSSSVEKWEGARNMVDLLDLVKKYYYHPQTNGSNSIKAVLPAVLNSSEFLKNKYSKPIYGKEIPSLNFSDHIWIELSDDGKATNPYKILPAVHDGYSDEELDELITDEEMELSDGGTAMVAYAKMQFVEMSEPERERLTKALLRYCELDTLAMVMLVEAWMDWCNLQ